MHTSGGFLCKLICDENCHKKKLNNASVQANVLDQVPLGESYPLDSTKIIYDQAHVDKTRESYNISNIKANTTYSSYENIGTNMISGNNRVLLQNILDNHVSAWKLAQQAIDNYAYYKNAGETILERYTDTLNISVLVKDKYTNANDNDLKSIANSLKYSHNVNILTSTSTKPGVIQPQNLYYAAEAHVDAMKELYNYVYALAKNLNYIINSDAQN